MTRTERLLRLARKRGDKAAIAILEADRQYHDDPPTPMFVRILVGRRAAA